MFHDMFHIVKHIIAPSTGGLFRLMQNIGGLEFVLEILELDSSAALFVVNEERTIVFWSTGATRLLGYTPSEVIGQHCLKANRCDTCIRGCGIAEQGKIEDIPLTLYTKNGNQVSVRKSAKAFFTEDGLFAGGIEILRPDFTSQKEARRKSLEIAPSQELEFHGIVTRDPKMRAALQIVANVAETDATVLIRGQSGTGKELIARAIHAESHRKKAPFVAINCAALTPTLLESELFGHKKGAFTGASHDRKGVFRLAQKGTLFLDEVAELSLDVQAKLLRVLEEREVIPVGASKAFPIDVRIVGATHKSIRAEVKAGRFREDLMYRLRVVPIFIPSLSERKMDIEVLLWQFIRAANKRGLRRVSSVSPRVMRALFEYSWPGNVRELRNVVDYAFAVSRAAVIKLDELPPEFRQSPTPSRGSSEEDMIRHVLVQTNGNLGEAAKRLGVSRPTLWRKRKKYGIR